MPARGKLHRERSLFLKFKTGLLDTPYLGIPGIVNFIDVRTQWFDAAVKKAIADGISQVGIFQSMLCLWYSMFCWCCYNAAVKKAVADGITQVRHFASCCVVMQAAV